MKRFWHFLIVLVLSASMVTYLYSYKPRNYDLRELISRFAFNLIIWYLIFGLIYLIIVLLIKAVLSLFHTLYQRRTSTGNKAE